MNFGETLASRGIARKEMMKRVARFRNLKGSDGGLPDSRMPGCERILYNVIGFQPPKTERGGKQSPVGTRASRMAAIKISEGLQPRLLPGIAWKRPDAAQPRLMFVIGGNAPSSEFTADSMRRIAAAEALSGKGGRRKAEGGR